MPLSEADAYGHGDTTIAHALQQAGAGGVCRQQLGRGTAPSRSGIIKPILILGFADPSYAAALAENDIATACFFHRVRAGTLRCRRQGGRTGQGTPENRHRHGPHWLCGAFRFDETIHELEALYTLPGLDICGVFQHFAVADSNTLRTPPTDEQHALFARVVARLQADGFATGTVHCANSVAQLRHPRVAARYDPRGHHFVRTLTPAMTSAFLPCSRSCR